MNKDFGGRQQKMRDKLLSHIYPQLRRQPYYGQNIKKLVNFDPPTWRYRLGNYRIFYTVDESKKIVKMLTIESRQSAYN